jgi:hypothetical protein
MGVDRKGIGYILFNDGNLFRVSMANPASCQPTGFRPGGSQGFTDTFGMGFAKDTTGPGETLYLASDTLSGATTPSLAAVDTTTFRLRVIGRFNPVIDLVELTGTGAGDLFAFHATSTTATDSYIAQLDKTNARVTGQVHLPGVAQYDGWAFAFWGGDFYAFTAACRGCSNSSVTRYRPSDGSITRVATYRELIVGAGVSTCAPQQ